MHSLLRDMLAHREWADVTQLRALLMHAPAGADSAIVGRVHHMLHAQQRFLCLAGGITTPDIPTVDAFAHLSELVPHAASTAGAERTYVQALDDVELGEEIEARFMHRTIRVTRANALAQSAMHSHHHRAQNATRLRELGGEPPATDLSVWHWLGRPLGEWRLLGC